MAARFGATGMRGFTLLEAIVSIVILGILAGMVAVFIRAPVDAYRDTASRAALTESAEGAIRRMARDIQLALPNSFRPPADGSNQCFEFIPVIAGGRYRIQQNSGGQGDVLNFAAADTSFDVLAGVGLNRIVINGSSIVIYNLGVAPADAYAGNNRARVTGTGAGQGGAAARISIAARQFPFESPSARFQVVDGQSAIYYCDAVNRVVRRRTQALAAAAPATCPAANNADPVLVGNVDCAASAFTYAPANASREGEVEILLTLTSPQNETVTLYDRVSVNNAP